MRVAYLDTGARVTHVFPGTPAWRVGLEPRDVIVSIDGYQIGYVNRQFYEISRELNYRAGRTGWVRLLVQNCRNDQLVNIDVQLARIGVGFPRERFDLPPGARLDQADEPAGDRDDEPNRKPRVARRGSRNTSIPSPLCWDFPGRTRHFANDRVSAQARTSTNIPLLPLV